MQGLELLSSYVEKYVEELLKEVKLFQAAAFCLSLTSSLPGKDRNHNRQRAFSSKQIHFVLLIQADVSSSCHSAAQRLHSTVLLKDCRTIHLHRFVVLNWHFALSHLTGT